MNYLNYKLEPPPYSQSGRVYDQYSSEIEYQDDELPGNQIITKIRKGTTYRSLLVEEKKLSILRNYEVNVIGLIDRFEGTPPENLLAEIRSLRHCVSAILSDSLVEQTDLISSTFEVSLSVKDYQDSELSGSNSIGVKQLISIRDFIHNGINRSKSRVNKLKRQLLEEEMAEHNRVACVSANLCRTNQKGLTAMLTEPIGKSSSIRIKALSQ